MKFTANRMLLYEAAKTALKIVSNNKDIPEISGVLVEANADSGIVTLTGTDIRTHIQCRLQQEHIEESGSIIMNPNLPEMLRLLDGDTVTIQSDEKVVCISSGNATYTMAYLKAKGFPKMQIPFPEDTIQVKGINSLIKLTAFAADGNITDHTKATFSYVKLSFEDGVTKAQAAENNCMAVTVSPHCADGSLVMLLHEKALQALEGIVKPDEELYVGVVGKFAVFMKEDLFFSSMMFDGNYIEASTVLEKVKPIYGATVDAKALYGLIHDISMVFATGDDRCINLKLENDSLKVQAKTSACSSVSEISVLNSVSTPPEGFYYLPKLFTDCLRHMTGPVKIGMDNRGFVLLEGNGSRYLLCPRGPMRIAEKAEKQPKKNKTKSTKSKTAAVKAA